jgi:SsrA-binding protein
VTCATACARRRWRNLSLQRQQQTDWEDHRTRDDVAAGAVVLQEGRVKVAIGLAKGKKEYDKRETIKRRETDRQTRAAVESSRR